MASLTLKGASELREVGMLWTRNQVQVVLVRMLLMEHPIALRCVVRVVVWGRADVAAVRGAVRNSRFPLWLPLVRPSLTVVLDRPFWAVARMESSGTLAGRG